MTFICPDGQNIITEKWGAILWRRDADVNGENHLGFQQSTGRNNNINIYKDIFMIVVISVDSFCG